MVSYDYVLALTPPATSISVFRVFCELRMFHRGTANTMEDGGWSSFQAPQLSTRSRLAGTLLLRPLHDYSALYTLNQSRNPVPSVTSYSFVFLLQMKWLPL